MSLQFSNLSLFLTHILWRFGNFLLNTYMTIWKEVWGSLENAFCVFRVPGMLSGKPCSDLLQGLDYFCPSNSSVIEIPSCCELINIPRLHPSPSYFYNLTAGMTSLLGFRGSDSHFVTRVFPRVAVAEGAVYKWTLWEGQMDLLIWLFV